MKEAQRGAMRQLPEDRKRFLVLQHRQSHPQVVEPLRATKTGPADEGLLSNVKRFSLATVGWGASIPDEPSPTPVRPVTTFGSSISSQASSVASSRPPSPPPSQSLPAQPTGSSSSWTSWWSSSISTATGTGQNGGERAKDTPQFYVDQMSSTLVQPFLEVRTNLRTDTVPLYSKISQRSLVKHLIALRVRLSTAKLSWTQEFLGSAKGLDALQDLLGKIALRKVNKGETPTEEDRAVQSEILKCLRVLMNTDVSSRRLLNKIGPSLTKCLFFARLALLKWSLIRTLSPMLPTLSSQTRTSSVLWSQMFSLPFASFLSTKDID